MNSINWPEGYLPGLTDNFVSNEVIVYQLSLQKVWEALVNTSMWPGYYSNASDIIFYDASGPYLRANSKFRFMTFGLLVESEIVEFVAPLPGQAARITWKGVIDGGTPEEMSVIHAWLLELLPKSRLRILTQESQFGKTAREMALQRPNPMLNAHQEWLDGLQKAASD